MTPPPYIAAADVAGRLTWRAVVEAMRAGHRRPRAALGDTLLKNGADALLSRSAWIPGLGVGVKSVTVSPENAAAGRETVQGAMLVFDDATRAPRALIDSGLVTNWKTAGDSVFGATLLARPDSANLLIIGAGVVAENVIRAYSEMFPNLSEINLWNRTRARAETLSGRMADYSVRVVDDLPRAAAAADILVCCTMSHEPVLRGAWVGAGAHVDLIGAFTPTMREADDALIRKGALFVDSYDTTLDHIGELKIPLEAGVIARSDVRADLYDLMGGCPGRASLEDITVFKNGGGAHLDLMTADVILRALG